MPQKASCFGDQFTDSQEVYLGAAHCTWCALYAIRQQGRYSLDQQQSYDRGDSTSSTKEQPKLTSSSRKAHQTAMCYSDRDSSSDESLSQKDCAGRCRRYEASHKGKDVPEKSSQARNTSLCCRSAGKAETTGTNAKCSRCPSPGAEVPKAGEEGKRECEHEPETTAGVRKDFRQIVMDSRCPCLCSYLHFADTVDACACVGCSRSSSTFYRDNKTPADVPDDYRKSPSVRNDKNSFGCYVARCFSALRKRSKRSTRADTAHLPLPLARESKNPVLATDSEILKDICCHQDLDRGCKCRNSCKDDEMLSGDVPRKPSKIQSLLAAGAKGDACVQTAPRAIAETLGKGKCLNCRASGCREDDAEKVPSRVRCTCECESRQKEFIKFRNSLQRICWALSGCKRNTCTCDCHEKRGENKEPASHARALSEENRGRNSDNDVAGQKTSIPKRGLLSLKYQILKCKGIGDNSKEAESTSTVCDVNKRNCHCLNRLPETVHKCSRKDARGSVRKTDNCCTVDKKKSSHRTCHDDQKQRRRFEAYQSKIASEGEEMIVDHKSPKQKPKQKRCTKRKSSSQSLHKVDLTGKSPTDDTSDQSELELRENGLSKNHEKKPNPRSSREGRHRYNTDFFSEPIPNPMSAEVIKIGNRYYHAISHKTAHLKIMSFKNQKEYSETHCREKGKKSPCIEVRVKNDTTSGEEDSSEAAKPSIGPARDARCHRYKVEQHRDGKERTPRDKPAKKPAEPDAKEATKVSKKRRRAPPSTVTVDLQCGDASATTVTRKYTEEKAAGMIHSSRESVFSASEERLPKAQTDPPSEKSDSPRGWISEGAHLKRKGVSAKTLELKQMSESWFAGDAKQWCGENLEDAADALISVTCDVRPFTASSSAS